jgi:putative addiction module component (TIGR02574 family)
LMSRQTQALLEAALALPATEREQLVRQLVQSLPTPVDQLNDEDLEAELDRRYAEYRRDPSVGIPWSKIKRST